MWGTLDLVAGWSPRGVGAVLFIGGYGRSGSTLLECLLARLPQVAVLGEVEHLWQRGVREDQLCACTKHFHDCPFWSEVGRRAFGGWAEVDVDEVLTLKDHVARQRRMHHTARRRVPGRLVDDLRRYAELHRAVYDAAREVSRAPVLVDSSKYPPMALALGHDPALDLRIIHLVRDSRGVAYSWSKTVERPETEDRRLMPRYSPAYSTLSWLSHNVAIGAARRLGRPVARIRYEDLVDAPAAEVRRAWAELGLPGAGDLPMSGPATIELLPTHSVAGNPMRFRTGETELRRDEHWRTAMGDADRRLVTAMTLPWLARWGYLARS